MNWTCWDFKCIPQGFWWRADIFLRSKTAWINPKYSQVITLFPDFFILSTFLLYVTKRFFHFACKSTAECRYPCFANSTFIFSQYLLFLHFGSLKRSLLCNNLCTIKQHNNILIKLIIIPRNTNYSYLTLFGQYAILKMTLQIPLQNLCRTKIKGFELGESKLFAMYSENMNIIFYA